MEEIKVENNDVVDTTKPAEETTPATPSEEVKTEYKLTASDRIEKAIETVEFLETILSTMQS